MSHKDGQDMPIEFWFDFASGYAYFAAQDIEKTALKLGRAVVWRPYMMGVAFKITGATGLSSTPMKAGYAQHDWKRIARLKDIPFNPPVNHPVTALAATRAVYWVEQHRPELVADFALAAINAYFRDGLDISDMHSVASLGDRFGLNRDQLMHGMQESSIKTITRQMSEEALSKGVFGSPFFVVDGEPFWGWDRIGMLEQWVKAGGW